MSEDRLNEIERKLDALEKFIKEGKQKAPEKPLENLADRFRKITPDKAQVEKDLRTIKPQ